MKRFPLLIAAAAIVGFAGPASAGLEAPPAIQCFVEFAELGGEEKFGTPGQVVSGFIDETSGQAMAERAKAAPRSGGAAAFIETCWVNGEQIGID